KLAVRIDILLHPTEKVVGAYDLVPRSTTLSTSQDPMKPAPPVTKILLVSKLVCGLPTASLFKFMLIHPSRKYGGFVRVVRRTSQVLMECRKSIRRIGFLAEVFEDYQKHPMRS